MDEDGLPHLRSSLRREHKLRVGQASAPTPRLVEGPASPPYAPPAAPRFSFWRFSLRAIPIIAAVASTSVLAYFLISERSQPFLQLQQPQQQIAQTPQPPQAQVQERPQQQQAQTQVQGSPSQQQAQTEVQEPEPPVPNPLPPIPSSDTLIILIDSALIALNQANATGNYTVLHDMAAPGLQRANSPERLAQAFADLRGRKLDLAPILLYEPKLYQKPEVNAKGMLRITGFFPTAPQRVNFDLIFQPVWGRWRLFGISANTVPAPAPQAAPAQPTTSPAQPATAETAKPSTPTKKQAGSAKAAEDTQVDIRDRIDNPPAPPPAAKPKSKSILNLLGQ